MKFSAYEGGPDAARRRFVTGLGLGGAGLLLGRSALAQALQQPRQILSGRAFDLELGCTAVNFTGRGAVATTVNRQLPGPLLRWRQGDTVTIRVRNRMPAEGSIHWHGIILPSDMDGVPGLSFAGIAPGNEYLYRFQVNQSGTYWYHSHSHFQEQTGLYGPIIIEPRGGERHPVERDYVVMLSDWTDTDPDTIYHNLYRQADYYNYGRRTALTTLEAIRRDGLKATYQNRKMWNQMRMSSTDLSDVSGHLYTYLMNGVAPASGWTGLFKPGERVKLRFINGSAMTIFDVRIPGLKMQVVAADGQDIEPVSIDEFRIGVAETYDVIVTPGGDRPWSVFAQSIDRSGYACGTLTPRADWRAEPPAMDARVELSMADMMGDMMSPHRVKPPALGVEVDMQVPTPRTNLDDPGVGLRDNGRQVLTYADLHAVDTPIATEVDRELTLHLTGNMERYLWSFDGVRSSQAEPLQLKRDLRYRFTLVNDTMMTHPIHLHGMWSELENAEGEFQVRKHTVLVQPAQQLSYRVTADAVGRWAYHCHLLYHMEAGMFREVVVA
ncbi:copper resistance system multicopper oxidase [Frateuria aurantia]